MYEKVGVVLGRERTRPPWPPPSEKSDLRLPPRRETEAGGDTGKESGSSSGHVVPVEERGRNSSRGIWFWLHEDGGEEVEEAVSSVMIVSTLSCFSGSSKSTKEAGWSGWK